MLNEIIIALWMTMLLAFFFESLKLRVSYSHVQQVNRLLEHRMMNLLNGSPDVSIFKVRDLREVLSEEFVKPHLIDDFELYRVDPHNLHMKYRKEQLDQEFEIHVDHNRFKMREILLDEEDHEYRV